MKTMYNSPVVQLVIINSKDIILTSGENLGEGDLFQPDFFTLE